MLIIAGVGLAASNGMLAAYYYVSSSSLSSSPSLSWLALFSLISYIVAYSIGWGPVPMLLVSEIFPSRARGLAASIAMLVNWVLAFCVTRYFAAMQVAFGLDGCFLLFACACIIAVIFVAKSVPETKGRSLEEIEHYFAGREFVRGI
jgi:SP family facilitated glucose transporter-like MFS transporter 8